MYVFRIDSFHTVCLYAYTDMQKSQSPDRPGNQILYVVGPK